MKGKNSVLYSEYIIDGIPRGLTPADILDNCLAEKDPLKKERSMSESVPVIDESTDPDPLVYHFEVEKYKDYLKKILSVKGEPRICPTTYAASHSIGKIAKALIDVVWMKGHFRLVDLALNAKWKWDSSPIGNMAAFYDSVEATASYIDNLGICLDGYSFNEKEGMREISFTVGSTKRENDEFTEDVDLNGDAPFGSENPVLKRQRAVKDSFDADPTSWIIFIPFDNCAFRLGSSLLCETFGQNGDTAPEIGDADYFIDSYEIVREFVEDGVLLSGATVSNGGLITALQQMCSDKIGSEIDIHGIINAYGEKDSTRVLFSEIPGAIIQIKDIDYDYVDAELLLQDVAYYPIGHPSKGHGVSLDLGGKKGISGILQSLINSQAAEGED